MATSEVSLKHLNRGTLSGPATPKMPPRNGAVPMGPPSVLFVDDGCWDSFFLLAAGIKRAGIRTVRITNAPRTRGAALLLFDRTVHFEDLADLGDLAEMVKGEHIVDVQMTESVAAAAGRGILKMSTTRHTREWFRRVAVMDKLFVEQRLRELGLWAPAVLRGPDLEASLIIRQLGLPVVHKTRTGSGGEGVSVITSRHELEALLAGGRHTEETFFEQYIEGRPLQFGGVFGYGDSDAVVTFETLERREALAPASQIRLIEERGFAATGRSVVKGFGLTGIMNINAIRDAEGRDWIHDVNPRAFGSFMGLRPAGVDLLQVYVNWIRNGATESAPRRSCQGTQFLEETAESNVLNTSAQLPAAESYPVFPAAFRSHAGREGLLHSAWRFARGARPYVRWVGPRYVAYETGRQFRHELGRLLDRYDKRSLVRNWISLTRQTRPAVTQTRAQAALSVPGEHLFLTLVVAVL